MLSSLSSSFSGTRSPPSLLQGGEGGGAQMRIGRCVLVCTCVGMSTISSRCAFGVRMGALLGGGGSGGGAKQGRRRQRCAPEEGKRRQLIHDGSRRASTKQKTTIKTHEKAIYRVRAEWHASLQRRRGSASPSACRYKDTAIMARASRMVAALLPFKVCSRCFSATLAVGHVVDSETV